jgi:hypothetical protein
MKGAIEHLQRVLTYTHQRQMFIQIQARSYVLRATPRPLHEWASELTMRYKVEISVPSDLVMALDWEVVELVFYDAFTNAKKYGHPDKKPWVQLLIHDDRDALLVNVCNVACPGAPAITTEMAAKILEGGKGSLSDAELAGNEGGAQNDSIRTSDGIGILNARKSAEALGGELCMYQEHTGNESVTTMQIQAPFRRFSSADRRNTPSTSSMPLLGSADGSTVPDPTKLKSEAIPLDVDGQTLQLGPLLNDVASTTTIGHHEPAAAGPKCFSLDDAPSLLKQYNRMLHKYLQTSESLVAGTNRAEVDAAVDIAMGRTMLPSLQPTNLIAPADIVTLDYDLGHPRLVGTDIAAQLHKEDFRGLVCILSGGSAEDLEALLKMPGVDMVCGKEVRLKALAPMLLENYQRKASGEVEQR